MKRIIAAIGVVAIVSSALAFNTNKLGGVYCASINFPTSQGGTCAVITDVTEKANGTGTTYYKFPTWNGLSSSCTGNNCNTQTTLYPQPH